METDTRKVRMTLIGADGNAFNLMSQFQRAARQQGWPKVDIDAVLAEARTGDYQFLLSTLMAHIEDAAEDAQDDYEEEHGPRRRR